MNQKYNQSNNWIRPSKHLFFCLITTVFITACSNTQTVSDFQPKEKAAVTISVYGAIASKNLKHQGSGESVLEIFTTPQNIKRDAPPLKRMPIKLSLRYQLEIDNIQKTALLQILGGTTERCSGLTTLHLPKHEIGNCNSAETHSIPQSQKIVIPYEQTLTLSLTSELQASFLIEPSNYYTYPQKK